MKDKKEVSIRSIWIMPNCKLSEKSRCLWKIVQKIINRIKLIPSDPLHIGSREAFWLVNEGFDLPGDDIPNSSIYLNIVYLELLRRGYQVYIGKVGSNEVYFIASVIKFVA